MSKRNLKHILTALVIIVLLIVGPDAFDEQGGPSPRQTPRTDGSYDRAAFGSWIDLDGDCLNTRAEILIRDGKNVRVSDCRVVGGVWTDPYTGERMTTPMRVQIDHVYPLAEAWRRGANKWSRARRVAFYNDPLNLQALNGSVNGRKSDQALGEWCIRERYEETINECPVDDSRAKYEALYKRVAGKYRLPAKYG